MLALAGIQWYGRETERSREVGFKVKDSKTKLMKINIKGHKILKMQEEDIEEIAVFTYLGSVITKERGAVTDAKTRISKANATFIQLYTVW